MFPRECNCINAPCSTGPQNACTLRQRRPRRHDIVHEQEILPLHICTMDESERAAQLLPSLRTRHLIERHRLARTDKNGFKGDAMRRKPR